MKIGVIGGGQLGLLTILEGKKLGVDFAVLDKDPNAPASKISDAWYPPEKVKSFVASCDVLTYEFEHIDPRIVEAAEKSGKLLSGTLPLLLKQDKIEEKRFLKKKGYPVPDFWAAENGAEALRLAKELRRPLILKISRFGYDGKGQFVVKSEKDLKAVAAQVAPVKERFLIEEFVPFEMEVSCVGVADRKRAVRFFPITQNDHVDGIL
ncbi:MAG TPA: ATP-grasp domain-containing protein, partial [Candidatus Manganitrophaceae bacterium]